MDSTTLATDLSGDDAVRQDLGETMRWYCWSCIHRRLCQDVGFSLVYWTVWIRSFAIEADPVLSLQRKVGVLFDGGVGMKLYRLMVAFQGVERKFYYLGDERTNHHNILET